MCLCRDTSSSKRNARNHPPTAPCPFVPLPQDGNGYIDRKEFVRGMAALGVTPSKTEASELFDTFDPDGSGEIEFSELHRALRKRAAAVSQAERRRDRARLRARHERWAEDAVRSHVHHGNLRVDPRMQFAMSSLGQALVESRSAVSLIASDSGLTTNSGYAGTGGACGSASPSHVHPHDHQLAAFPHQMYAHNLGSGYGYSSHGLVPSGHSRASFFLASNRASGGASAASLAASLVESDDLSLHSVSASAVASAAAFTIEEEEDDQSGGAGSMRHGGLPQLRSSSNLHARTPLPFGQPPLVKLSSLHSSASQPSLARNHHSRDPNTQSMDSIHTTGGTSIVSNATVLGTRTHTLPRAAVLQAERIIRAAEAEEQMRRSASSSIIGLPTNSYVIKERARKDGGEKPLSIDHLSTLWMQPRPGKNPLMYGAVRGKVAPAQAVPFTPSFLPPLSHTQVKPSRPPSLSPSASQKTVDEMHRMHQNKLFGSATHRRAANGSFYDADHRMQLVGHPHHVPGIVDNRGAARDKAGLPV